MPLTREVKDTAVTGDGVVKTGPGLLYGVALTAAAAAATIVLYDNTAASGTILLSVKAAINLTEDVMLKYPIPFSTGVYADSTGASAAAYVFFE